MTIAACYFSSEGVVFGADSTTTSTTVVTPLAGGPPKIFTGHFNHAQKIFEIGEHGTLGINMWGNGRIGTVSHRKFIAEVSENLVSVTISSVEDASRFFADSFWKLYTKEYATQITRYNFLCGIANPTPDEEQERVAIEQGIAGGYCIGGNWHRNRNPQAFEIQYSPKLTSAPVPKLLPQGVVSWWGCPDYIGRLLFGIDATVHRKILASGKWTGTPAELDEIVREATLFQHFDMPLREAIDFIHAAIHTTIKAFKFSQLEAVCGGPIEIAVIAADRRFRWVKHKSLDQAVT